MSRVIIDQNTVLHDDQPIVTIANDLPGAVTRVILNNLVKSFRQAGYIVTDNRRSDLCPDCGERPHTKRGKFCPECARQRRLQASSVIWGKL